MTATPVAVIEPELDRLEGLWSDGLADSYHAYLDTIDQPKLALAAALIEVGLRLQGLGSRAAPPTTLLMGDLCLSRGSRLLADHATLPVQVAFARAIELLAAKAASEEAAPQARQLLTAALGATR